MSNLVIMLIIIIITEMNSLFLSKKKPMIYLYVTKCQARQKRYLKSEIILKKQIYFTILK